MSEWTSFSSVEEMKEHEEQLKDFIINEEPDFSLAHTGHPERRAELENKWNKIANYIEKYGLDFEEWHPIFGRLKYHKNNGDDSIEISYSALRSFERECITLAECLTIRNGETDEDDPLV